MQSRVVKLFILNAQILLEERLYPFDDWHLLIASVSTAAKSRHHRKYLVDVVADGPALTVPASYFFEFLTSFDCDGQRVSKYPIGFEWVAGFPNGPPNEKCFKMIVVIAYWFPFRNGYTMAPRIPSSLNRLQTFLMQNVRTGGDRWRPMWMGVMETGLGLGTGGEGR